MKNETLRANITAALAGNVDLAEWIDTNFSKSVTVFDGIDRMQLPQPEDDAAGVDGDYPFIAVDITDKAQGPGRDDEEVTVSVFAALIDSGGYEESAEGVRVLPGIEKRDQFRTLILSIIAGADLDGGMVNAIESVNLPVEFFPEFAVDITVAIVKQYLFRENRFE